MDRPYTYNRLTMIQVQKNSSLSIINTFVYLWINKLSRPFEIKSVRRAAHVTPGQRISGHRSQS